MRTVARIIRECAATLLHTPVATADDAYAAKYSGVRSCAEACTAILTGDYCNIELFSLYEDSCYHVMDDVLRLVLATPPADLVAHPKLYASALPFLQCMCDCAPWRVLRAPVELWPPLFAVLRDALALTTSASVTAGASASQRAVAAFVQALAAVNRLLACLVCILHGAGALTIGAGGGGGTSSAQRPDELVDEMERFDADDLRARARHMVDTGALQVFPSLVRPAIARAASLPYADKSSTAHLLFCTALLLHHTPPNASAAAFADVIGRGGTSGGGIGMICELLDEQAALQVAAQASVSAADPEAERVSLRLAIEAAAAPLRALVEAALGAPLAAQEQTAHALLGTSSAASVRGGADGADATTVRNSALRELFELRLSELFVRFVESTVTQ